MRFTLNGPVKAGPEFSWTDHLRWWAIRKIAGAEMGIALNLRGNEFGQIKLDATPVICVDNCRGLRMTAAAHVLWQIYDDNPYSISREG